MISTQPEPRTSDFEDLSYIVSVGAVRWRVVPTFGERLLGPKGLRLDEWRAAGAVEVVKHGPHRTVSRITLPDLDVHLKHYRLADTRAWLRQWFRVSKARQEYESACAVARCGVPTVRPLAIGEGRSRGESYLITQTAHDTESLGVFLEHLAQADPTPRIVRLRQAIAHALANLLARMHDAGIRHDDLHAGNLLVRLTENDEPQLFLIDLHAVRLGAPLDWPTARDNLVLLNRWFLLRASRTDRRRFFDAYHRLRLNVPRALVQARAWELEEATWVSNRRFWAQRERRCQGDNRSYQSLSTPEMTGHAVTDLDASSLATLTTAPDAPFAVSSNRLLKDSRSSTVVELDVHVHGEVRRAVWKRIRATARDPWLAFLRRPSALRSWVYGHSLLDRGLPTPRPLLVLHRRRLGSVAEGYVLTEQVADAQDLAAYVSSLSAHSEAERRRTLRELIDVAARVVRDLHEKGLSHRDLKAANVLVQARGDSLKVYFIDLVGVTRHRVVPNHRRVQNLARLNASFLGNLALSRTDRVRFLRTYLTWGLRGKGGWKGWWREVAEATRRKEARNARLGRPLA